MKKPNFALVCAVALFGASACENGTPTDPPPTEARVTDMMPRNPIVTATGACTSVTLRAEAVNPNNRSYFWTVNGEYAQPERTGQGGSQTVVFDCLPVGLHLVCTTVSGETGVLCNNVTVTRNGFVLGLPTARSGPLFPTPVGTRVCYTASGQSEECIQASQVSEVERPSWIDRVGAMEICVDGPNIEPRCYQITSADELAQGVKVLLFDPTWTIQVGDYAGQTVQVSLETGYEKSGTTYGQPTSFYPPTLNRIVVPEGSMPVKINYSASDSIKGVILETLTGTARRMWGISATLVEGDEWDGCNSWVIKVDFTTTRNSASVHSCGNWHIQGGEITLGMSDGPDIHAWVLRHEWLHTLGAGHTEGWPSIMASSPLFTDVMSATDVAYIHAMQGILVAIQESDTRYHPLRCEWLAPLQYGCPG